MLSRTNCRSLTLLFGLISMLLLASCARRSPERPVGTQATEPFRASRVVEKYRAAACYSDQARLVLHYSLNQTPFEEVHPCSFQGSNREFCRSQRFCLDVVSDSRVTVAKIMDPTSQNLGGQVLCVRTALDEFWNSIQRDSIGVHFANGNDHIPWNPRIPPEQIMNLLNTSCQLYSGQPPEWLSDDRVVEAKRVELEGRFYDDVTFESSCGRIICRFDPESLLLLGLRLPVELLAPQIANSPEVRGLSLAIIFEQASFAEVEPVRPRLNQHELPVVRFVRLPEEFPAESIGKLLKSVVLLDGNNQAFQAGELQGSPAVFVYGSQDQFSPKELERLESLAHAHAFARFVRVHPEQYSPNGSFCDSTRLTNLVDARGDWLKQVGVSRLPFVLMTDSASRIQFVAGRDKSWLDKIGPALSRVRDGEDLALEMHHDYARYYADYQQKLEQARAEPDVVEHLSVK